MKKVIIFGNVPLATWVTSRLLEADHVELLGIVCDPYERDHFENHGMKEGSLYSYCIEEKIRILSFEEAFDIAKQQSVLGISVRYHKLFKEEYFSVFTPGIINLHGGELPRYRGANIANYAIIEDAERGGGTLHFISKGIDEGDIVERVIFNVSENETAFSYFQKTLTALQEAFESFLTAIDTSEDNSISRTPQEQFLRKGEVVKTYYKKGLEEFRDIYFNEDLTWDSLYRRARAFYFPGHSGAFLVNGDERIELKFASNEGGNG